MKKLVITFTMLFFFVIIYSQNFINPQLVIEFNDFLRNHNMHIVCDGQFYYTVNGGNTEGLINKFDLNGKFLEQFTITLDMRSIMYNSDEQKLYVTTYDKGIYRIDDLQSGQFTKVFSSLFDYDQASLAISVDNKYLYYYYSTTVKKFDFKTGELVQTFSNIKGGYSNFGGDGAIAVDDKYFYTCNTDKKVVYVYNLCGIFVKEFSIPYGDCGMALSFTNNLLFISKDGNYSTGTWYGYKIFDNLSNNLVDFSNENLSGIWTNSSSTLCKNIEKNNNYYKIKNCNEKNYTEKDYIFLGDNQYGNNEFRFKIINESKIEFLDGICEIYEITDKIIQTQNNIKNISLPSVKELK